MGGALVSVAKVTTIAKSRKDQGKCGKCGKDLPAGTGYLYWLPYFRSNTKRVRCLDAACYPAPSERESSKAATIYAAQEAFDVDAMDDKDEIEAAVQEVADAVTEVKEEYDDALSNWEYGNEALQEKVDHYESQASELDGWQFEGADDWEQCDDHYELDRETEAVANCETCQANQEEWLEEIREAAREKVNEVEVL
jgi:hypothetical protein